MIYSSIFRYQSLVRESINGMGMILFGVLSLMIVAFMFNTWYNSKRGADWSHMPGVPTACALLWIFADESYRCAAVWSLYRFSSPGPASLGAFATADFWPTFGYLVTGFGLVAGLLRGIYLFTPPLIRKWVWKAAASFALIFIVISHLLRT